jgi:hypothetical protein
MGEFGECTERIGNFGTDGEPVQCPGYWQEHVELDELR